MYATGEISYRWIDCHKNPEGCLDNTISICRFSCYMLIRYGTLVYYVLNKVHYCSFIEMHKTKHTYHYKGVHLITISVFL